MPWPSSADDPALKLIRDEEIRQNSTIQLIASENFASPATMAATGSVLTNKYLLHTRRAQCDLVPLAPS